MEDRDSKPSTRKVLSSYKLSQKVLLLDSLSFGNSLGQNHYGELCNEHFEKNVFLTFENVFLTFALVELITSVWKRLLDIVKNF